MEFGLFDGRQNSEYTGVGFVAVSITFATNETLFLGTISFDRVYATDQQNRSISHTHTQVRKCELAVYPISLASLTFQYKWRCQQQNFL